jgi:type IV pilus assembly protein PilQ
MFYKIMKFSKIRALSILLIILIMLFAGCASSTAIKQADQKAKESLNLITNISLTEDSESLVILIKAQRLLTYTSVKQPMPLSVVLYFPETALGKIETALTSDSDIVMSIKASELTENGHTSRIEIALKKDAPYEVTREGNGLQILFAKAGKITASAEVSMPAAISLKEDKDKKPAWINRVDFSSEDAGKSTIIIGTTRPVKYKINKAADKRLQLILFNTNLPDYRKRPLITTRFNSAVDRITPIQTPAMKNRSMIAIELRESVPYYIEQAKDLLLVHFDASSISPRPFEQADLPSWKKVMAQASADPEAIEEKKAEDKVLRPKVAGKYTGEKIALDFYDTDIKNVFRILMEISGKNFAIDKDVTGKVTLVTLQAEEEKLKAKLKEKQDAVRQEDHITVFIPVKYGSATEMNKKHIKPILTTPEEGRGESQAGKSTVEDRINTIVITDVPLVIKQAKEIIQRLDMVTPQVIIEARIVEATTNFSREIGVEWNAAGGIQSGDPNAGIGPQRGYDELGGTYGYDMAMNFPIEAVNPATIGFNFLRIAGTPLLLNAKLMAMEAEGEGKIISSPKIVTLDNKKAVIKQGVRYPYNKLDESGNTVTEFEDIDLVLEVTPHVTPDQRISMIINITKKDLGVNYPAGQSFNTKEASTELLVDDGNTVVIGGIIKTTKQFDKTGVPWLSKIPILGWLFKSQAKEDLKEELLIFITPQIVRLEQRDLIDD